MLVNAELPFIIVELFLCVFYSFEWFVRFMAFKRKKDCLRDGWFVFDSVLVLEMFLETVVLSAVLLIMGANSGINGGILRLARLLRLSRMARMARLLRTMP